MKYAEDLRLAARRKMTDKWSTLALITFIISLILGACTSFCATVTNANFVTVCFSSLGTIAALVIGGPFELSQSKIALNVSRGKNVTIEQTFDGFKNFVNAFLLSLINSIFVALWSLLFFIPGIIKDLSYSMSFYLLADNPELTQDLARAKSVEMMDGNKWRLFCLRFSFIGWYLLGIITCGILMFWVIPYVKCAEAEFYKDLINEQDDNRGKHFGTNENETASDAEEKTAEEPFEELN